ncbi:hypothetical protein [uncultured Paraglaciecola sp.]|uniref:hypothetical protein n=1 Tax=uncultured Paraglaciecola sp. TaxID=1765024 RepID=UPI0025973F13|nr:hypothetical protein [uncultured Paraglaciecola sp.]
MTEKTELELKVSVALKEFVETNRPSNKVKPNLSAVTTAISELPLTKLEYWERYIRDEYDNALASGHSNKWAFWQKNTPPVTLLDLCSWDGFRREKALRAIGQTVLNRFFLALVLRRLNDWVPQVRQAAQGILSKVLVNSEPSYVADAIFFTLSHWSSWKRVDDSNRNTLLNTLSNREITNHLKMKLLYSSSGPLVLVMSEIGRTCFLDSSLEVIAVKAIQPSLRAKAYRSLFEGKSSWFAGREWEWTDRRYGEGRRKALVATRILTIKIQRLPTLLLAANDRSSLVRRVAAEMLIKELDNLSDNESLGLAKKFSNDPSIAVAERGNFALKKLAGGTLF